MRSITANLQVWLPLLIIPIIFGVLLPGGILVALTLTREPSGGQLLSSLDLLNRIPPSALRTSLSALPAFKQKFSFLLINHAFAPFFLIIPLMTASVISADSFAGEKERGTLEGLLLAPVDLLSLFVGKTLAALLPALAVSLLSFLLYGITANAAGWGIFRRLFFPQLNWLPLLLLMIPAISLAAVLLNVFISARVTTFQAAYQMGALIILPVLLLLFGQVFGVLVLGVAFISLLGLVLAALDALLLWVLLKALDRMLLFESQVH